MADAYRAFEKEAKMGPPTGPKMGVVNGWIAEGMNGGNHWPRVPLRDVLKLVGADEIKLTATELSKHGHTKQSFRELPSAQKHLLRYAVLREFKMVVNFSPHLAINGERVNPPQVIILPKIGDESALLEKPFLPIVTTQSFPLNLDVHELIQALWEAVQERKHLVQVEKGRTRKRS
jgi:hypothetical protein